jgi:hypothetical protein
MRIRGAEFAFRGFLRTFVILLLVGTAIIPAACGSEEPGTTSAPVVTNGPTSTSTLAGGCSASSLDVDLSPEPDLPVPVAATREALFTVAMACDFADLEELATMGSADFTFSFGDPEGGPAAYWRAAEERGEPVLAWLVTILNMPYGRVGDQYVWPFAHALDFGGLSAEQKNVLEEYFSVDDIAGWEAAGGYMGYRVGISPEG